MMASICKRARIEPIGKTKRKIDKGPHKGEYKEANLYYGFHSLRHFMASHLADQEKVGTKAVSGLLRHKNLRTTEIYLHSIDESQRSAMEGFGGKFAPKKTNPLPAAATKNKKEATDIP
jgi:integrase